MHCFINQSDCSQYSSAWFLHVDTTRRTVQIVVPSHFLVIPDWNWLMLIQSTLNCYSLFKSVDDRWFDLNHKLISNMPSHEDHLTEMTYRSITKFSRLQQTEYEKYINTKWINGCSFCLYYILRLSYVVFTWHLNRRNYNWIWTRQSATIHKNRNDKFRLLLVHGNNAFGVVSTVVALKIRYF